MKVKKFILFILLQILISYPIMLNSYGIKSSFYDTLMYTVKDDCMHCFTYQNGIIKFAECSPVKTSSQRFDIVNVKHMSLFHRIKFTNPNGDYLTTSSGLIEFRIIPANGNDGYYILSTEGTFQCLSNKINEEKELVISDIFRNCKNLENSNSDIVFYFKQNPDNRYLNYKVIIKLYKWNSSGINYELLKDEDISILKTNFQDTEFIIKNGFNIVKNINIINFSDLILLPSSNIKYELTSNLFSLENQSIACSYKIYNLNVEFETPFYNKFRCIPLKNYEMSFSIRKYVRYKVYFKNISKNIFMDSKFITFNSKIQFINLNNSSDIIEHNHVSLITEFDILLETESYKISYQLNTPEVDASLPNSFTVDISNCNNDKKINIELKEVAKNITFKFKIFVMIM